MKKYLIIFKIKIFLFSLFTIKIFAIDFSDKSQTSTRFTLSSGYLESTFNSNEGMAYFPMSVYETYDWGFRKLSADKFAIGRFFSAFFSGLFQVGYFSSTYMNVPFHEFGHATRFRYFGSSSITYFVNNSQTASTSTYFGMIIKRAGYPNEGAATSGTISYQNATEQQVNSLISTAGGMNNEILLTKNLAERVFERGGTVPDFFFYFADKLSPYNYSRLNPAEFQGGDPQKIESSYAALGKNITRTDLQQSYLFSLLASGTFYSLLWGNLKYIWNGEQNIKTLDLFGFTLPDFSTFINSQGLSMEGMLRYKVNNKLSLGLAYEKVYLGGTYEQISPQIRYVFNINSKLIKNINIKPQLVFGFDNSIDVGGSFLSEFEGEIVGLFLKYTYYNINTLYGERNIPSKDSPNELLAGVYFNMK
ncbi:hypothetical protein [Fluviispira vulneris]|uniref:hypothetical protein n=1 Tax=Fluviispira vulneris TaxID=2763012 RepID=UPI001645D0B8|nr:hypothetical protein [Fluviispira vulneris]